MASIKEILSTAPKCSIYPIELLEKLHTKQLLKMLRTDYYLPYCKCGQQNCDFSPNIFSKRFESEQKCMDNIKQVLATREHVPSRAESKRARIERIKRGR